MDQTQAVSLSFMRRYLKAQHWNLSASKDAFELFAQDNIELILPRKPDAGRAVEDALRTLSQFEDRPVAEIINAIRAIGFDRLRSRLPDSAVRSDGVPLQVAAEFVHRARDLLASSATSEMAPTRAFGRNRKDAIDYSHRCVFGHTFRGSFGFVIESPVTPNDDPALLPVQTPPFERRVIERLMRGLCDVEEAVKQQSVDAVVGDHLKGFNANMCEDFATLIEKVSPSGLVIEVALSPEWAPTEGILSRATFTLDGRHAEVAEAAARHFRTVEVNLNRTIAGRVVRLESSDNPQELFSQHGSREIAVNWNSRDLGSLLVRVALQPKDYLEALEAHRQALPVSITGRLDRVGRTWWLVDHSPLQVHQHLGEALEADDEDDTEDEAEE